MNTIITKNFFFFILFIIFVTDSEARDKNHSSFKVMSDSIEYDEYIIDTGDLVYYVSNNTRSYTGYEQFTFLIGNTDEDIPSMDWREGGYYPNSYLYSGLFFIGCKNDIVRFSTKTSNDFVVMNFKPRKTNVRFSMTDDSTEFYERFGVKCINDITAYYHNLINDYVIYEYTIINTSNQILEDVYTGFNIDGDVSSASGGSGTKAYYRDDLVDYYMGIDKNGHPESISYMFDGDNPYIAGNDSGGCLLPKENLGFIGSRVLKSPQTKRGVPADQQSGHNWWNWCCDPDPGIVGDVYSVMKSDTFKIPTTSPHDYQYLQTLGPWDINAGEQIVVALALGIGVGLEGLRYNLQLAYDLYKIKDLGPQITSSFPDGYHIDSYVGETITFCVKGEGNPIYRWMLNEYLINENDSTYTYLGNKFHLGNNVITCLVSDGQYTQEKSWMVKVNPAKKYDLFQNYPNPFNGVTTIPFELEKNGNVKITVYDILGRKVKTLINKPFISGKHKTTWDGTDVNGNPVSSGFYFYQIKSGNYSKAKRLLILR